MAQPLDVVITGAGRGLGRGVAVALAGAGWRVWVSSEIPEELERTAEQVRDMGGSAHTVVTDLSSEAGCEELVRAVQQGAPRLRAVVNNAAVLNRNRVEELSLEEWSHTQAVNLTAPFLISRDLLPLMTEGGSIINVSSRAGISTFVGEAAYCVSKFGIEALTGCLALETADRPISVNTITPGRAIKPTSITDRDASAVPKEERESWTDPVTLGPAFVFLANLRGEVTGRRFNAATLADALERDGREMTLSRINDLYER
jgi:NAD(P)-dependent dehydrogenase (short-subunit alcohol dehydrogenase family)